jgi:predicted ribosomally synthesized peptide with SipW-like signal peptide
MKKILFSFLTIMVVGGVVAGATRAYFTDTETSAGNAFTAGALNLTVDSFGAFFNGAPVLATSNTPASWLAKNLTTERFFEVGNVKPGDLWKRNISLHMSDNPAWICLRIPGASKQNLENIVTDPETKAGDLSTIVGELGQNIQLYAWIDSDSDGKHDSGEKIIASGAFDNYSDIAIHDSTTGNGPLTTSTSAEMIQMELCAGTPVIASDGTVSCNGASMGNAAQTDSLIADLAIYGEQSNNNPAFTCGPSGGVPSGS